MTLTDLVEAIRAFDVVVVTGPQRSGTTIATKVLAEALGIEAILEETFREDDLILFGAVITRHRPCVVQAPALSGAVHLLKAQYACVVFVKRSLDDVITSQERIDWTRTHEFWEKSKYHHGADPRPIALLKADMWEQQRHLLGRRAFDLEYESLTSSRLWVPKELRTQFGPRQTEVSYPDTQATPQDRAAATRGEDSQ
jgi:hypothetical protein